MSWNKSEKMILIILLMEPTSFFDNRFRSITWIDGADHARHDLVHRRVVQRFDEASRTGPHPRRNVETPNLVADRHAGRLMPAHHNRKAGVSRAGSARRDGDSHADAQRVDLPGRDHHEAMTILHLPPGDRVGVDPIDVAAARNVAANHQPISRPTGSPSWAQAASAVSLFIPAEPFRSSGKEYRLRFDIAGSATSFPRSTERVTCAPTSSSMSCSSAGGIVSTAAPPCLRILDVMAMSLPASKMCNKRSTFVGDGASALSVWAPPPRPSARVVMGLCRRTAPLPPIRELGGFSDRGRGQCRECRPYAARRPRSVSSLWRSAPPECGPLNEP